MCFLGAMTQEMTTVEPEEDNDVYGPPSAPVYVAYSSIPNNYGSYSAPYTIPYTIPYANQYRYKPYRAPYTPRYNYYSSYVAPRAYSRTIINQAPPNYSRTVISQAYASVN